MTTMTTLTGTGREAPTLTLDGVRSIMPEVDSWLRLRSTQLRVPGVQAAVFYGDELVLSTAHGLADVERNEPMTTDHLFRIASHSKTFTATAVMQLFERGRLRLDDRLDQWLSDLDDDSADGVDEPLGAVTVRELLSHSSGLIRDGEDGDFWQRLRPFPDRAELREMVSAGSQVLPPNERFKYSNVGFSLLGLVIEAASGQTYHDFVNQSIIAPLGLTRTGPEYDPARAREYAAGHTALIYGNRKRIEHCDTRAMASATGFYSTAEEVCRYASAHFVGDRRLISEASKRAMRRTQWEVGPSEDEYGLGFKVVYIDTRRMVGHGGGYPGHITSTLFDPVERLAVSVLTNAIDGPAQELLYGVIRMIELTSARSEGESLDPLTAARYTGRFASMWTVVDVVAAGGRLIGLLPTMPDPTAGRIGFDVIDEHTLRVVEGGGYGSRGEAWRFERDASGEITSVRAGGGMTMWPFDKYVAGITA